MKILVVDDEIASQKTLELFVKKLGHEAIVASDGAEGFEIWKKQSPNLVVTDWNMPVMNGGELIRKIRENEGDDYTYIVVVTVRDSVSDVVEGLEAGADDYITKPFNKEELNVRLKAGERVLAFQSRDIVIFGLAKLAGARDPDAGNHLERMREYCKTLAETVAELPEAPAEVKGMFPNSIYRTCVLHDIGMIGIPYHILLKHGNQLNDVEFRIMKHHTIIGFNTLNEAWKKYPKAGYLKMSAEIARSHHEKWDGTGYPDGLKGTEIPMAARIVGLADFYDEIVTEKHFREAFSHETAVSLIEKAADRQFDPLIVKAFLNCADKFKEIHDKWKTSLSEEGDFIMSLDADKTDKK